MVKLNFQNKSIEKERKELEGWLHSGKKDNKNLKVVKLDLDSLEFDNGVKLYSYHESDCCENHYLSFSDLTLDDFEGLEFDLSNDDFFERIEGYGIALKPIKGFPIRIPGYGENNGYYSENLSLIVTDCNGFEKRYDVTECQKVSDGW